MKVPVYNKIFYNPRTSSRGALSPLIPSVNPFRVSLFATVFRKAYIFLISIIWKNEHNYDRVEATLGDMSEVELKAEFRFGSGEINLLYEALRIPESFTCINGTVATGRIMRDLLYSLVISSNARSRLVLTMRDLDLQLRS